MGQGQSSNSAASDEAPAKADYYDLLGVERNATEDELKKAYRRKALELHPDRNYGNVDHATHLFAEVQTAYEVLSDAQERAWYDSHRDILLRGDGVAGDGSDEFSYHIRMTTAVEVQKLMLKFNGKLEFTDAPSGFYGGLNDFFSKLGKEEDIACQWEDENPMDYPQFGSKDDRYEDVVRPFYAAWTGFATRKSFAWKDQYRLSEAPNRIVRRLMEKENKKIREDAAQEYNDAVRSLVAFVRKRDPRVANNQKSEAERQKTLRDAAAAQAARSKAAYQARMKNLDTTNAIPDWAQSRSKDQYEGGFSSESEVEEHEYECVVCDKTFKSDAQFKAHEKSKKHIKQLNQLKRELGRDNIDVVNPDGPQAEPEEGVEDANDDGGPLETAAREPTDNENDNESDDGGVNDLKASKHVDLSNASSVSTDESNDDYASREAVETRLGAANITSVANGLADASLDGTPATSDTEGQTARKVGKAKQKRAKKAAQQQSVAPEKSGSGFNCATCKAEFPSKTKLFDHLKEKPKHAAPILQTKPPRGAKDKKR